MAIDALKLGSFVNVGRNASVPQVSVDQKVPNLLTPETNPKAGGSPAVNSNIPPARMSSFRLSNPFYIDQGTGQVGGASNGAVQVSREATVNRSVDENGNPIVDASRSVDITFANGRQVSRDSSYSKTVDESGNPVVDASRSVDITFANGRQVSRDSSYSKTVDENGNPLVEINRSVDVTRANGEQISRSVSINKSIDENGNVVVNISRTLNGSEVLPIGAVEQANGETDLPVEQQPVDELA